MAGSDYSRIATNIAALTSLNSLNRVNSQLGIRQLRLATGRRINSAADDAAGLTIATKFDLKAKGLGQALANIADAKSLMSVAEGHLNNINDILGVMRTKAEQAANDTLGESERAAILDELAKLNEQINAECSQARWGSRNLFGSTNVAFQVGYENADDADVLTFNIYDVNRQSFTSAELGVVAGAAAATISGSVTESVAGSLDQTVATATVTGTELNSGAYQMHVSTTTSGTVSLQLYDAVTGATMDEAVTATVSAGGDVTLDTGRGLKVTLASVATATADTETYDLAYLRSGQSVSSQMMAREYMISIDTAVSRVSKALSYIGSMVNRLDYQETSVSVAKINTEAAYNRIMNADMAYEQVEATKYQILQQTATTMLAQANVQPQSILSLFR